MQSSPKWSPLSQRSAPTGRDHNDHQLVDHRSRIDRIARLPDGAAMTEQRRVDQVVQFLACALNCKPTEVNRTLARDLVRAANRKPATLKARASQELEQLFR